MFSHSQNSDEGEHRHEETDIERVDKIDTIEETVADQEHEHFQTVPNTSPVVYASSLAVLQLV